MLRHTTGKGCGMNDRLTYLLIPDVTDTSKEKMGNRDYHRVSGTWIGVTGMINVKGAAGLAKRVINRIVIAITNCYRTTLWQLAQYTVPGQAEVQPLGAQPDVSY